jgi:hypothetical protein
VEVFVKKAVSNGKENKQRLFIDTFLSTGSRYALRLDMQPVKFVVISFFEKYVVTNKNKQSWLLQLQVKIMQRFKTGQ